MSFLGVAPDPFDGRRVLGRTRLADEWNALGVLSAADVHVATRLAQLAGEQDESVCLAVALAVRAPRLGHVHVDLARIRDTAAVDADEPVDLSALPWPEPEAWTRRVAASPLVAVASGEAVMDAGGAGADAGGAVAPLRLVGSWLYLDRYWALERELACALRAAASEPAFGVSLQLLADGLRRLFPGQADSRQCRAAAVATIRRFAVVAGGPGTGKTTTVARIVALLDEQACFAGARLGERASGVRPPLVALAAPTGKAAAALEQAVHREAAELDVAPEVRERMLALRASTIHRLLGWRPGSFSRFHHDRNQRLPHDVVIVDETSMVSLAMMARLVEAIRPGARIVLVGDPGQLASIEAGAVLGDIVGPAATRLLLGAGTRDALARVTARPIDGPRPIDAPRPCAAPRPIDAGEPPPGAAIDGIVVLDRVHRFGAGIAALADAIRRGETDAVLALLADPPPEIRWLDVDVADPSAEALVRIRERALAAGAGVFAAADGGRAADAVTALRGFRLLCAHRRGPHGMASWTARIESWLEAELPGFSAAEEFYVGRPLLITENDYELGLFNGDTGVIVRDCAGGGPVNDFAGGGPLNDFAGGGTLSAAFERRGETVRFSPARLGAIDTVQAMTIHKSQGSQFDAVTVLLPAPDSPILTRELLYTAVTRARERVLLAGTEESIRRAVERPVARASGLRQRLWG